MDTTRSNQPPITRSATFPGPDVGTEELVARLRELKQDLLERERALDAAQKAYAKLEQSRTDEDLRFKAWVDGHVKNLKSHIELLKKDIETWKHAFNSIVESTSWKLTGPVRLIAKGLRKVKGATKPAPMNKALDDVQGRGATTLPDAASVVEGQPPSIVTESAVDAQMLDRFRVLEDVVREMLAGVKENTGSGKYIHATTDRIDTQRLAVKAIAFYTLQYIGSRRGVGADVRGIDWGDISTMLPRYVGHYQPHVPDELGHCDQRVPGVLEIQAALASQYGIYGFCFRYPPTNSHLFADPVSELLRNDSLDIRFCVCFDASDGAIAEEGSVEGVGCARDLSAEVDAFLARMAPAFSDSRYIRVAGKPLLAVCGEAVNNPQRFRDRARGFGFENLYLVALVTTTNNGIAEGFDAVIPQPSLTPAEDITADSTFIDRHFEGRVYSYQQIMERHSFPTHSTVATFENVITGFDNEPIRPGQGTSLAGSNPALYARWLERCCRFTAGRRADERFFFITSWNNWAEGAHLEPDRSYGYGYLHATANVLRYYHRDPPMEALIEKINAAFSRTSDVALIFHCYYEDLINSTFERYFSHIRNADLFVTVRIDVSRDAIARMQERFPNLYILRHENRGRDIRPFLFTIRHLKSLGYRLACKVHTKKTPQADNEAGELWRHGLLDRLLGTPDSCAHVIRIFKEEPDLGLLVPTGSVLDLHELRHHVDNTFWLDRFLPRLDRPDLIGNYDFPFPAGSMYWFRMDALDGLDDLVLEDDAFEPELGQRDGTLAHTVERLVPLYALRRGFQMKEIDLREGNTPTAITISGRKSGRSLAPEPSTAK